MEAIVDEQRKNNFLSAVYLDEIHPEAIRIGDHVSIGLRSTVITHLSWGRRQCPHLPHPQHGPE
jgi:hypothetical protein